MDDRDRADAERGGLCDPVEPVLDEVAALDRDEPGKAARSMRCPDIRAAAARRDVVGVEQCARRADLAQMIFMRLARRKGADRAKAAFGLLQHGEVGDGGEHRAGEAAMPHVGDRALGIGRGIGSDKGAGLRARHEEAAGMGVKIEGRVAPEEGGARRTPLIVHRRRARLRRRIAGGHGADHAHGRSIPAINGIFPRFALRSPDWLL